MSRKITTLIVIHIIIGVMAAGQTSDACADQAKKPARKSRSVTPSSAAPDRTSTIPTPKPPEAKEDEPIPAPFNFPAAPRARMRACGEKWEAVKMSGRVNDQTWRDFATKCLVEPNPTKSSSSVP